MKTKSLLTVASLFALVLTGCGTDEEPSSGSQSGSGSASETSSSGSSSGKTSETSSGKSGSSSRSETSSTTSKKYTITWKNYNGTVLETDRNVPEGTTPTYDGNTPTRASDSVFVYTWNGWTPEIEEVSRNRTYTATFSTEYSDTYKRNHGIIPVKNTTYNTITYGLYPQTYVSDSTLINKLNTLSPESNGWYFYDNEYYATTLAATSSGASYYEFRNGTKIVNGTKYWFKCEKITWNILENNNGVYYLLTSSILDTQQWYHSQELRESIRPNNYKYSDIRAWLNDDFYNSAFSLDDEHVVTANVDNSPESTHSIYNSYCCEDTLDNVCLPSYQDYINEDYGFEDTAESSTTRKARGTDWALARGLYYSNSYNKYYSPYWTRSPARYNDYMQGSYDSWDLSSNGTLAYGAVDNTNEGVRPAIRFILY